MIETTKGGPGADRTRPELPVVDRRADVDEPTALGVAPVRRRRGGTSPARAARAAARRARVAELHREGLSAARIAERLGVPLGTVNGDLRVLWRCSAPLGDVVVGRDGKTYAARRAPTRPVAGR